MGEPQETRSSDKDAWPNDSTVEPGASQSLLALLRLAQTLEERGDETAAADAYRRAIADAQGVVAARATTNLARLLERQGEHEAAIETYRDAIIHSQDSAIERFRAASTAYREANARSSETTALQATEIQAKVSDLVKRLALLNEVASHSNEAIAAQAAVTRATLLESSGNLDAAIETYREAITRSREAATAQAAEAQNQLRELLKYLPSFNVAVSRTHEAIAAQATVAQAFRMLAQSGYLDAAVAAYSEALKGTESISSNTWRLSLPAIRQDSPSYRLTHEAARRRLNLTARRSSSNLLADQRALYGDQHEINDDARVAIIKLLAEDRPDLLRRAISELIDRDPTPPISERVLAALSDAATKITNGAAEETRDHKPTSAKPEEFDDRAS